VRALPFAEESRRMLVAATKIWTLDELHSLPDDGNTYELVHGELFVTPAPAPSHETIVARLARVLEPYVVRHDLGYILRPRAVVQHDGSQVEPDLSVRKLPPGGTPWTEWPVPILVIEILSPSTRRRDREQKRTFYGEVGVTEYWIVDPDARTITCIRSGRRDVIARDAITWEPVGVATPLVIELATVFA
jgi:Uma2 family endonuclease